jgi:hypothetical protein
MTKSRVIWDIAQAGALIAGTAWLIWRFVVVGC